MSSASLQDFYFPTEIQKDQQYDAVIVFAEEEAPFVTKLVDVLKRFVTLEDGCPPRICVLDEMDCLNWIQNRFEQFIEALNRSTSVFVYFTESLLEDRWAEMQKNAVLTNKIYNNKGNIFPLRGDATPDEFFKSFKGVDITKILTNNRKLTEVDDVENLISDDFHPQFLTNFRMYFNRLLQHRKEREKKDEEKRREWMRTNSAPMPQPVDAPASRDSSREQLPPELRDNRQHMVYDGSPGSNICVVPPLPNQGPVNRDRSPSPSNSSGSSSSYFTPPSSRGSSPSPNMDMHQDPHDDL